MDYAGFPGFGLPVVGFLAALVSYGVGIIYDCCVVGFIGAWWFGWFDVIFVALRLV